MSISLTVALKRYFGYRQGQGLTDFAQEIKALTDKDKQDYIALLTQELKEEVTLHVS